MAISQKHAFCYNTVPHLVTACLEALKCVLPASLVIKAHLACYASVQVPHSQDSRGEWNWFTHCVLDLMGYPPDSREKVNGYHSGSSVKPNTLVQASTFICHFRTLSFASFGGLEFGWGEGLPGNSFLVVLVV